MKKSLITILCLLTLLAACSGGKATEAPAVAMEITSLPLSTKEVDPNIDLYLTSELTSAPNNLYEDVKYKPASDRYPEMNIPKGGTRECNIAGKNVIFADLGGGVMQITSGSTTFIVTEEGVKSADITYVDGWVKLPLMGRISVAYTDDQWRADWLKGCPVAAKTPGPP